MATPQIEARQRLRLLTEFKEGRRNRRFSGNTTCSDLKSPDAPDIVLYMPVWAYRKEKARIRGEILTQAWAGNRYPVKPAASPLGKSAKHREICTRWLLGFLMTGVIAVSKDFYGSNQETRFQHRKQWRHLPAGRSKGRQTAELCGRTRRKAASSHHPAWARMDLHPSHPQQ